MMFMQGKDNNFLISNENFLLFSYLVVLLFSC